MYSGAKARWLFMGLQKPTHCNTTKWQVTAQHGGETK